MKKKAGKESNFSGFCKKVWALTEKVPKGKVTTYKIIAEKLGTKAYRAVGKALNVNPYAPRVPCHRVVGSDGTLTGYAHGLKAKESLVRSEGVVIKNGKVNLEKFLHRL